MVASFAPPGSEFVQEATKNISDKLVVRVVKIASSSDSALATSRENSPRFQDSKIPRCQDAKMPKFQARSAALVEISGPPLQVLKIPFGGGATEPLRIIVLRLRPGLILHSIRLQLVFADVFR